MNYYDGLIKEGCKIDFLLIHKGISEEKRLEKIRHNSGNIFYIPNHKIINRVRVVKKCIREILKTKSYDVVHVNFTDLYAYACITQAKKNGIKKIIYHIHNPKHLTKLLFLSNILNERCIKISTDLVACSEYAGKSVFKNNKFTVIRNIIDTKKFKFNENERKEMKKYLGVEKKIIIGTVGRIVKQKNPMFTVKIVKELIKMDNNIHWICIGKRDDKKLRKKMDNYISKNRLNKKITIIDVTNEVNKFYSSMDIFLLPSKYEGLGIVFMEAQCNGLKVYASNNVPKEIEKTDLVKFISLKKTPKYWAKEIYKDINKKNIRGEYDEIIKKNGYDIENNKNKLIEIYSNRRGG